MVEVVPSELSLSLSLSFFMHKRQELIQNFSSNYIYRHA